MSDTTDHGTSASEGEAGDRPLVTRFTMEVVTAAAALLTGVAVMVGAHEYSIGWGDAGPEPGYFPFWLGAILALASLGALVQALLPAFRRREATGEDAAGDTRAEVFITRNQAVRVAQFAVPVFLFVPVSLFLGLYVATAIYLLVMMIWQGGYSWYRALIVSIVVPVLLFFLFERAFQVPLLKGPLEAALGIY